MEFLAGNLLVASSTVSDPVYAHGVCLVVHHQDDSIIGVMLNRPLQPDPAALLKLLGKSPPSSERFAKKTSEPPLASPLGAVHFGGPLSGPVVAIHQISQYAEAETGQGIYVAAQKHNLESLVLQQPSPYRLIVGHLGWKTEQLQSELDAGVWHMLPATAEVVFSGAEEMWPGLIRRATTRSMARWIGMADVIGSGELN